MRGETRIYTGNSKTEPNGRGAMNNEQ